jgi:hypothetical protein
MMGRSQKLRARTYASGHPQWVAEKPIVLKDAGIDKNLADRAHKLNSLSPDDFETLVSDQPALTWIKRYSCCHDGRWEGHGGPHVKRRKVSASGKINGRAPPSDIVVVEDDKPILLINGKSVTAARSGGTAGLSL